MVREYIFFNIKVDFKKSGVPLNPPTSFLKDDFKDFGLSMVELLITKPSTLFAKLIRAISLICSSFRSGAILKKIGVDSNVDVLFFLSFNVCTKLSI